MKLIFAGTPEFAAIVLDALLASGHEILAVYTQPDRPAGRGRKLLAGPVKELALDRNLTLRQPRRLAPVAEVAAILAFGADAIIVAAYGLMLPQGILSGPTFGCINVHASLLPRWRGASPIQHSILSGDPHSGITIMQMEAGLDTGPILRQCSIPIQAEDTGGSLHDRLAQLGAECLLRSLNNLQQDRELARVQEERLASYAPRLSKSQARIDWHKDALTIERMVRAFNPWPVAHTLLPGSGRQVGHPPSPEIALRVHTAQAIAVENNPRPGEILQANRDALIISCGEGALKLLEVQLAGRRRLPVAQFLNACPLTPGDRFQ